MDASLHSRVIVHIDLDCFYAQVEARRLGVSDDVPLGVQQWGALIAVSYAARRAGVAKVDTVAKAKAKCPGLVCVHVEVIGGADGLGTERAPGAGSAAAGAGGGPVDHTHAGRAAVAVKAAGAAARAGDGNLSEVQAGNALRTVGKVSLERYRKASHAIFGILVDTVGEAHVEKAGLDEAFLDITALVDAEMPRDRDGRQQEVARANAHPKWLCLSPLTSDELDW